MRFTKLKVENFLAITEAEFQLDDRGLVLIQGVNEADTSAASNGAGKSSIADALCWCWFGTTARGITGDDVINTTAGKNTLVRSEINDGTFIYVATRCRKHKTGKNGLTIQKIDGFGTVTDLTKGTDKLTQEVVNQIIGASLDVFSGSIYAGQERMPDLPAMTDKNLKMLIEEAAGVTALEAAYKKAREVLSFSESEVTTKRTQKVAIEGKIMSIRTDITGFEQRREQHIDSVKEQMRALKEWLTGDAKVKLEDFKVRIAKFESTVGDDAAQVAAIDALKAKINAVKSEEAELRRLEGLARDARIKVATAESHLAQAQLNFNVADGELNSVDHQLGCPCASCGRAITETELEPARKAAQKRLDDRKASLEAARAGADQAAKEAALAVDAVEVFRKTMTDVSETTARVLKLSDVLNSYRTLVREANNHKQDMNDKIKLLTDMSANKTKTPFDSLLEEKQKALADEEKRLKETEDDLIAAVRDAQHNAEVVRVFAPAGVRARILDDVTPFLNAQTARYLSVLSDGNITAVWNTLTPNAKGELRENFTIDVTNATGGQNFHALSGGEKRKVRISTALALQDLVATRATKPIELFIGDEIDDALDAAGLERLMVILEDKAKERGSVFIISHNEIRDMCRNVLTITKTKGGETKIVETTA